MNLAVHALGMIKGSVPVQQVLTGSRGERVRCAAMARSQRRCVSRFVSCSAVPCQEQEEAATGWLQQSAHEAANLVVCSAGWAGKR